MSYNFKSLGEVELLDNMPEAANVLVEVDGGVRRAPQVKPVDEIAQIVGSETLEEVPEGATVLAEVGGEIKRVPSDGLGGGKTLIIKSSDFDNAMAGVAGAEADAPTFSANMTFDEFMTAFAACEPIDIHVFLVMGTPGRITPVMICYDLVNYTMPCVVLYLPGNNLKLYWTADNVISFDEPELNSPPI